MRICKRFMRICDVKIISTSSSKDLYPPSYNRVINRVRDYLRVLTSYNRVRDLLTGYEYLMNLLHIRINRL